MVDPITNMPIIILRDSEGQKVLPIWVGVFEANAIALQIENIQTPRPMTHDLLRNIIQDLQATRRQDRRLRPEGEHLLRADPPADAGRPGRDRRAAERRHRPGAAHARADPGRREGHRPRQDRGPVEREAGQRSPAAVARAARPRRHGQVQDVVGSWQFASWQFELPTGNLETANFKCQLCRPADNSRKSPELHNLG